MFITVIIYLSNQHDMNYYRWYKMTKLHLNYIVVASTRIDKLYNLTMAEANQELLNFLSEIAKDNGYENGNIDVQPISTEGANYTSDLFLATISAPKKEALKLFAKVAKFSENTEIFKLIFGWEHSFYTELATVFEKLYKKNGVPAEDRLFIPKFYGYKCLDRQQILVLENLAAKGFGNFDRMKTFNWDYASRSVEELAKFHALGLALKEENPVEFDRLCKFEGDLNTMTAEMRKVLTEQAYRMGTQVIKEEYRGRIRKYFETNSNFMAGMETLWNQSDTGFLMHGDYRPNNLMHRRRVSIEASPFN